MKPTNYPFTEEYSRYLDDRSKRKDAYLNWEVCGSDGIWRAMYGDTSSTSQGACTAKKVSSVSNLRKKTRLSD